MRYSIDEFKKKYPALFKELFEDKPKENTDITLYFEGVMHDPWRGYVPGPIDYIRRSKSLDEALDVINYLEKRGEISSEEARMYREKLLNEGLEAFGPRKEDNYYYKRAKKYWKELERIINDVRQQQQS